MSRSENRASMNNIEGFEGERFFDIKRGTTSIGRGAGNDIQVNDLSVSRDHAKILREGKKFFIVDLGSKNGTWLYGHAVKSGEKVEIHEGDSIALGNTLVSVDKGRLMVCLSQQYAINLSHQTEEDRNSLLTEERRVSSRENIELIYKLCLTLMQTEDVKEICEKILNSILLCLKRIDSGYILVRDPETGKLEEISAHLRNERGNAEITYSKAVVNKTFRSNKAIIITDTSNEKDNDLCDEIKTMGVKSIICVPLSSKMGTVGVIYLHSFSSEYGFRSDDHFFVSALSTPAALAIENARLHARSRQVENELRKTRDELEVDVKKRTMELVVANNKLEELSFTDGLTGLFNYRYLVERLESEYHRARRYNHDLALVMVDIDHFKKKNDRFGHPCGDLIIKHLASLLKKNVRNTDFVARYGGDELAIILLETNESKAVEISEKLRQKIEDYRVPWKNRNVNVTVSMGVAAVPAEGFGSWEGLLHAADKALYQAKKAGKNSVAVFTPGDEKE